MELNPYAITSIPSALNDFILLEGSCSVAYKYVNNFCYSFVHFGDNTIEDEVFTFLESIVSENINGILKNYVNFYSPHYNHKLLDLESNENFTFCHLPYIAFGQIPFHIDITNKPPIKLDFDRNYLSLCNRTRPDRFQLFNFLKDEKLLDKGFVSYRNVNHHWDKHFNDESVKLDKPYLNFEDALYPKSFEYKLDLGMLGYPRQFIWYYPVEKFLFDFALETHDFEPPFLTEKSTKAFFWGKIPVVTGSRNLMAYLEQFGFDIFRDIIDYRYDIQKEQYMRMDMYLEQVKKLANIDIQSIHNLKLRLEYNRNLVCNLVSRGQQILKYINDNTNYISNNKQYFLGY